MSTSNLKAAILAMMSNFKPFQYDTSHAPKARNSERSKRQMTKKGAMHKQGYHFLGRPTMPLSPAMYRKHHLGMGKKAADRLMKKEIKNGPQTNH